MSGPEPVTQHLPGQHDQETHGGGGTPESDEQKAHREQQDRYDRIDREQTSETERLLDPMSKAEIHAEAVRRYTGSGYVKLNRDLRGGSDPSKWDDPQLVYNIDDSMRPTPADVVVYRHAGRSGSRMANDLKPGDVFKDDGFVSTSASEQFAENWDSSVPNSIYPNTYYRILVPKGTAAIWVDGSEYELILGRGKRYEVVRQYKNERRHRVVEVRVLP